MLLTAVLCHECKFRDSVRRLLVKDFDWYNCTVNLSVVVSPVWFILFRLTDWIASDRCWLHCLTFSDKVDKILFLAPGFWAVQRGRCRGVHLMGNLSKVHWQCIDLKLKCLLLVFPTPASHLSQVYHRHWDIVVIAIPPASKVNTLRDLLLSNTRIRRQWRITSSIILVASQLVLWKQRLEAKGRHWTCPISACKSSNMELLWRDQWFKHVSGWLWSNRCLSLWVDQVIWVVSSSFVWLVLLNLQFGLQSIQRAQHLPSSWQIVNSLSFNDSHIILLV